jgi:hypothetical protein
MVRGTYLPWPVKWGRKNVSDRPWNFAHQSGGEHQGKEKNHFRTSLGEESAESVIGVGVLALLSEESIGLSTV